MPPLMHEITYDFAVTTAPAIEPLTLAEVKTHIRHVLADDDSEEDAFITNLIVGARQSAENITHRQIITASLTLYMDRFPDVIRLPRPPIQGVTSVVYVDESGDDQTLVEGTDYQVDASQEPGRIAPFPDQTWPTPRIQMNPVTVVYVAGYGDAATKVPDGLRNAISYVVAQRFENRESSVTGATVASIPHTLEFAFEPYIFREFR